MNPSERLLSLYSMLLFSPKAMSLKELASRMGCSKQTITRDMNKLEASSFGKLVCEKQNRECLYRLERPGKLPKLTLDAGGLQQLALCRSFLMHLLPKDMQDRTEKTLQCASAYMQNAMEADYIRVENSKAVFKGAIDYTPLGKILELLIAAIHDHQVCRICYRAAVHGKKKTYYFAPKELIAYHEALYVRGWVVIDKGNVIQKYDQPTDLAVHRMVKVSSTNRRADSLPNIVYDEGMKFGLMHGDSFKVKIRFAASVATYITERLWSVDQSVVHHQDGSLSLTMTSRSEVEVISWVLSFGDAAELLSPVWLRQEVVERVKNMAECYAKKRMGTDTCSEE